VVSALRKLVPEVLAGLASRLRGLQDSGHFNARWVTDGAYNRGGWLHARVWAALVQSIPPGFVPNLEARLPTPGRSETSYKPDVVVCDAANRVTLAIELESTNSSDDRVVLRDIDRLKYLAKAAAEERPDGVLLVTVLPSRPVVRLPMYDGLSPASVEGRARRRANPYAFHRDAFLAALREATNKTSNVISVAWANIDVDALRLEFWDATYKKRPSWPLGLVSAGPSSPRGR
jgi:hypothetical protein